MIGMKKNASCIAILLFATITARMSVYVKIQKDIHQNYIVIISRDKSGMTVEGNFHF